MDPVKKAEMDAKINALEIKYNAEVANIERSISPQDRVKKLTTLKQNHATKKSQVRKSFGVTMRQRNKPKGDKNSTPIIRQSLETFKAPPGSAPVPGTSRPDSIRALHHSSPIISSGFSPVNVPRQSSGSAQTPLSSLRHSQPSMIQHTSFRAMQPQQSDVRYIQPMNPESYAQSLNNKRRRTDEGSRESSSHFGMAEVSAEDAAGRMARKIIPAGQSQTQWEPLQPKRSIPVVQIPPTKDEPMTDIPRFSAAKRISYEVVTISSSDDEVEAEQEPLNSRSVDGASDQVLPSVEGQDETESDNEGDEIPSTATPSSGKLATRGRSRGRGRGRGSS
jgi:hypothetical protein